MHIRSLMFLSALSAALSLAAPAAIAQTATQGTTPKTKPVSVCKGLAEAACTAPACTWVKPTTTKAGKKIAGYCRTAPTKKASSTTAPKTPAQPKQ
jgi:hypothetical protein